MLHLNYWNDNIEPVDDEFKLLNMVVDVAFQLLINNIEFVYNEFKFVFFAYPDKLGALITVELESAGKYDGLFIIVEFQSDWKFVGLLSIFVYCRCVNPVALPYKHWFESIVKASVL